MNSPLRYQPSAFYFRSELSAARTKDEAVAIGMMIIAELEHQKEWTRAQGLIPPKFFLTPTEYAARPLGEVIPFSKSEASAPKEVGPGQILPFLP